MAAVNNGRRDTARRATTSQEDARQSGGHGASRVLVARRVSSSQASSLARFRAATMIVGGQDGVRQRTGAEQ